MSDNKEIYVVGICGASGSGKSTFVRQLKERFSEDDCTLISMDNYYLPIAEQLVDEHGYVNFDRLESFDNERLISDVSKILSGETLSYREYVYNDAEAVGQHIIVKPAPIVILEGLFVLAIPELLSHMNLKLYIEAHDHKMLIRRLKRDLVHRNLDMKEVMHQWECHVYPSFKKYIEPSKEIADLVINNNQSFNNSIEIISEYLKAKKCN